MPAGAIIILRRVVPQCILQIGNFKSGHCDFRNRPLGSETGSTRLRMVAKAKPSVEKPKRPQQHHPDKGKH
jgi:hypothetical protein